MRFGSYEVLEQVGVGSSGTVFRARELGSGRLVAVKLLSVGVRSPGVMDRFRAEAAVLGSLDDPHVVALLGVGLEEDPPWIAEQWVEGSTLDRVLQVHGRLSGEQAVGVLRGAVQGLAHAHSRGVVHRDVAPGNVLLDTAGTSMLVDFGLAVPVGNGGVCGTPAFLSPEAATGAAIGPAGDVYSAGAVLFLLLAGRPPFPAGTVEAVLAAHREQPAPPLDGERDALADLVARCLRKDPSGRPRDGAALLAELDEHAARRFGTGWLSRASVTALIPAALRATTTTSSGSATGTATGTGETVAVAREAFSTGTSAPDGEVATVPAGRLRRPGRLVTGAVAAVAVVGLGTVGALSLSRGDGAERAATPAGPTTPILLSAEQVAQQLNVRYRVETTLVASTFPGAALGETSSTVWTVAVACTSPTACEGDIASDDGSAYGTSYDGKDLSVGGVGSGEDLCVDEAGTEVPGSLFRATSDFSVAVPGFSALLEGVDVVMGTQKLATTNTPVQNCEEINSGEQTWSIRIMRLP